MTSSLRSTGKVLTMTRSSPASPRRGTTVGFLKNPNRLNVAVSRARERLVIVGNERTLRGGGGSNWQRLLDAASVVSTDIDDIAP
jgi:superfamily I DNA and/or RNA helicase